MYPLRASTYQFSLFSLRRKKKKKEINQRIYASSWKKVEGNLLFFFLDRSVARNHEILGFEACIRWNRASFLRGNYPLPFKLFVHNNSQKDDRSVFPNFEIRVCPFIRNQE